MKLFTALGLSLLLCTGAAAAYAAPAGTAITAERTDTNMTAQLNLTQEWDKIFPQSDKVNHSKITFRNRYGITLAADMYVPKNAPNCLPLQFAARLAQLRNRHPAFMRRKWQSAAF